MRIQFNTNRQYSPEGQPIVGYYSSKDNLVTFADVVRSIYGEFTWTGEIDPEAIQAAIMQNYDGGSYQTSQRSQMNYQFEKKVWKDTLKDKNRSKAGRQLIEQLEKLDNLADDIRAQFEEIANEFHQDEGPALDPQHSDSDTSYELYELAYDVSSAAEDLRQKISEYQNTIKQVTK